MPLPSRFYTAQQVKKGEASSAQMKSLPMFALMERAGQAVFTVALAQYPTSQHWLICCGGGNNGGDGYIVANVAKNMGQRVTVWHSSNPDDLQGDALRAYYQWVDKGGEVYPFDDEIPDDVDLIIDGLLGIGLSGEVREPTYGLINIINQSQKPVVSIDIPSGLNADTGAVLGVAVRASHTISFIGMKQGLVTGQAREYTGQLHFAGLGVSDVFDEQNEPSMQAIEARCVHEHLPKREACAHKGSHGKTLLVGGDIGMGGAMLLAAQACARVGSGLTAVALHGHNVMPLLTTIPEVMSIDWQSDVAKSRLDWCHVIGIGPGLGKGETGKYWFDCVAERAQPKVMDADALFFLAHTPHYDDNRIMTPHPAEAARLLGASVAFVEADRFKAVRSLHERYGGVIVLKGAGTLVYDGEQLLVCTAGNPGMATGGMGDVLTGVITSLVAQGLDLFSAAQVGVWIHSNAADKDAALQGERGLLASDLIAHLRQFVN
ncbi:bifunctional ADP-dependent NAD(P)H-hydrate dehydratase/NAD(P)H-hydrate epimerase [Vibrio palustris]|uniref:Bifunctional NAD(P)H-hydrate repair enzyme n=1 Tax=Vibrio palustris TaxID=1918946 RepID=A0A1R4B6C7_9VIBR|nr:bifunctional ADP-dependent NAD(P)H-hydrate dehydratase/NAD(P)H-hydrate epimerase [Vibrio palustris]SJL84475.1 Bifunctional NAD(P)H-hydrate repair enzyme Nnr [Vibrio palustris]